MDFSLISEQTPSVKRRANLPSARRWATPLASGEKIDAWSLTEPNAVAAVAAIGAYELSRAS